MLRKLRNSLQNHPFPVDAFFKRSLVLTFAAPADELEKRIPECLSLDTFENRLGFIAVAMVETKQLRPSGFPAFLGSNFFLIGYRIFVRFRNSNGGNLRGLYILRSETDKRRMEFLGQIFTRYRYVRTNLRCETTENGITVEAPSTGFAVAANTVGENPQLPEQSPFADWREARRFSGPLPFTFSFDRDGNRVSIVEGVRQNWTPRPVSVEHCRIPFLESLGLRDLVLANAFLIEQVPYHWKKGRSEPWKT